MSGAAKFLTAEQLAVVLNTPGTLYTQDGAPASDDTLGSELERYHARHGHEILAVNATFRRRMAEVTSPETDGSRETGVANTGSLSIRYFQAWTEAHVLVVLDSIFGDQYLAVLPRHPVPGVAVKETGAGEAEVGD